MPLLVDAPWAAARRREQLERLFEAVQDDGVSYLEPIASRWGEICGSREEAAYWVGRLEGVVQHVIRERAEGQHSYFVGMSSYLSCLLRSGQEEKVLDTIKAGQLKIWHDRSYGVRALRQMGRDEEALAYAEASRSRLSPYDESRIYAACEAILIDLGREDEAFERYAATAHPRSTYLATFRAVAKRYPERSARSILRHLADASDVDPGKWFAAAVSAGERALALELAAEGEPAHATVLRAALKHREDDPPFALGCALVAAHLLASGRFYEADSSQAHQAVRTALELATDDAWQAEVRAKLEAMIGADPNDPVRRWMRRALDDFDRTG